MSNWPKKPVMTRSAHDKLNSGRVRSFLGVLFLKLIDRSAKKKPFIFRDQWYTVVLIKPFHTPAILFKG